MKPFVIVLFIFLFIPLAFAAENRPTADSVRELMAITETQKMLKKAMGQIDAMTQQTIRQATAGQPITPAQIKILENYQSKMVALYQEEMSWERLEPVFIEVYQNSFNQHEIDGLIAFYRTDLGQAVIHKMPVVVQDTMQVMQGRMIQLMPRLQALQREMVAQLQKTPVP